MIALIGALGVALATGGCASKTEKVSCQQRDWYEIGRRDGAQGASLDRLKQYKQECGGDFSPNWETVYVNGRNAGLVDYCMPENAFELGRMGISYLYVCPSTVEPRFLAAYRRGQQARKLELKQKELDTQIDSITQRLLRADGGTYESRELSSQLDQLKKLRAANQRQRDKISK
jgi:hypothetical protein